MSDVNAQCDIGDSTRDRSGSFAENTMMDTSAQYPQIKDSDSVKREHDFLVETVKRQKIDEEVINNDSETVKREHDIPAETVKRQKIDEVDINNAETYNSQVNEFIKTEANGEDTNGNTTAEELTNKLPLDELLLLFSWLPAKDLVTVKRVCHSWREAAQEKCLWKTHVLHVSAGDSKDERKVKLMPAIQTINGVASNSFLNIILENMHEISKLNLMFEPSLSPSQVALVLEKYPELESISLCSSEPDILECLEKLKASKHLKEILFSDVCNFRKRCASSSLINIFKMFTDCNNFTALTHLDNSDLIDCIYAFEKDESFRNVLAAVITKRSHQLLSLKLNVYSADCTNLFSAISSCVKLQTLHIFNVPHEAYINIERMSELKSLGLHGSEGDRCFKTLVHNSLKKRGSWNHLTEVSISLFNRKDECNVLVLKAVIDNVKELRILQYTDYEQLISEHELKGIGSLIKLKDLYVSGLESISKQAIGYISECHRLKSLELDSHYSKIVTEDPCITEMLLKLKDLKYLFIRDHDDNGVEYSHEFGHIFVHLESRVEIERHMSRTSSHA